MSGSKQSVSGLLNAQKVNYAAVCSQLTALRRKLGRRWESRKPGKRTKEVGNLDVWWYGLIKSLTEITLTNRRTTFVLQSDYVTSYLHQGAGSLYSISTEKTRDEGWWGIGEIQVVIQTGKIGEEIDIGKDVTIWGRSYKFPQDGFLFTSGHSTPLTRISFFGWEIRYLFVQENLNETATSDVLDLKCSCHSERESFIIFGSPLSDYDEREQSRWRSDRWPLIRQQGWGHKELSGDSRVNTHYTALDSERGEKQTHCVDD
ncbi:hypothetical protein J6590_046579 [Homalodisca vitripennis]|nr:hypothetical protein J6590_046579 [Homalodisca vitripennis]